MQLVMGRLALSRSMVLLTLLCSSAMAERIEASPGEFLSDIPYARYVDDNPPPPAGRVFHVREFGAIGDGSTVNTEAFRKAIEAASRSGGGTVLVEDGDYVSGTIRLVSHVTLRIAHDATLRASRAREDYDPTHFIYCEGATEVGLEGPGKIVGEGDAWWTPPRIIPPQSPPEVFRLDEANRIHGLAKRKKVPGRPSPFIRLREASDVRIRNLVIENSPGWTVMLDHCDRVRIEKLVLNNNYHGENTDGIDIVGSNDVEVATCFISTGDDGIVLKNGFVGEVSRPMRNIRIEDCVIRSAANAIKIGTETWSDISHVRISRCEAFTKEIWPWGLSAIAIESVDGAKVHDVRVESIRVHNVMTPLFIRLGNRNRWKDQDRQGAITGVFVRDIEAYNVVSPCIVSGIPGLYIRDVTLENVALRYHDTPEELHVEEAIPELEDGYPEFWNFGDLPAYGLYARHVDGLKIRGFSAVPRTVNTRQEMVFDDVLNLDHK